MPTSFGTALNRSARRPTSASCDRRVLVLVDGDDGLGILHARQVMDRARDADRDIDFGRDDLAGLANQMVIGHIARVYTRAGCAHGGVELVGEREDHRLEGVRILQRAAARNDGLSTGELGALALGDFHADEARKPDFAAAETTSTAPEQPSVVALAKALPRTVITSLPSKLSTVAMALLT